MGRLWHTLLLSKWNPMFAWLPVESIIHDRQKEYYAAINMSNDMAESTVFIEFMLSAIKTSLIEAVNVSDEVTDQTAWRWKQIDRFLSDHAYITNTDVREICQVSSATANRILRNLADTGRVMKVRKGRIWAYQLVK